MDTQYTINVGGDADFYDDIFNHGWTHILIIEPSECWTISGIGRPAVPERVWREKPPSIVLPPCTGESLHNWLEDNRLLLLDTVASGDAEPLREALFDDAADGLIAGRVSARQSNHHQKRRRNDYKIHCRKRRQARGWPPVGRRWPGRCRQVGLPALRGASVALRGKRTVRGQ